MKNLKFRIYRKKIMNPGQSTWTCLHCGFENSTNWVTAVCAKCNLIL